MEDSLVARATAAASSIAAGLGLDADEAVVVQSSNTLALRLLPCNTFARVAVLGQEVAVLEVQMAMSLAALAAPVAALDPRVEPRVHHRDGFAITFWRHHARASEPGSPGAYASALHRLHEAMRNVEVEAPHFTERIAAAERLLVHHDETPSLADDDRRLLLDTLHAAGGAIDDRTDVEQLLHGEPHLGNLLWTPEGPVFIDLETCCYGPLELDVAHAPVEVSTHYPGVDEGLVHECRRLVLAMVAAWRFDVRDEYPEGRRHGEAILGLLRAGPPWPVLGALPTD